MTKISRTKSARLSWFTGKTSREIERGTWKSEIQSERKKTRNCSSPANQRSDQILAALLIYALHHISVLKSNSTVTLRQRSVTQNISNVIAVFVDFHHLLIIMLRKGKFFAWFFWDLILGSERGQPVEPSLVGPSHSYRVTTDIYLIYSTLCHPFISTQSK